jgi:hypothetical protein
MGGNKSKNVNDSDSDSDNVEIKQNPIFDFKPCYDTLSKIELHLLHRCGIDDANISKLCDALGQLIKDEQISRLGISFCLDGNYKYDIKKANHMIRIVPWEQKTTVDWFNYMDFNVNYCVITIINDQYNEHIVALIDHFCVIEFLNHKSKEKSIVHGINKCIDDSERMKMTPAYKIFKSENDSSCECNNVRMVLSTYVYKIKTATSESLVKLQKFSFDRYF